MMGGTSLTPMNAIYLNIKLAPLTQQRINRWLANLIRLEQWQLQKVDLYDDASIHPWISGWKIYCID